VGPGRTIPWDWYSGSIPDNVVVDETAYVETTYSFALCRSEAPMSVQLGRGSSTYLGTMFDLGPAGEVSVGDYALVNGARIICDGRVDIGDYTLVSWNVVIMDTYRASRSLAERRRELERAPHRVPRRLDGGGPAEPVSIGRNVWIGFDACVLPGVRIGEGAVVGARSVVTHEVAPYTVVAGNPARVIRRLEVADLGKNDGP
jgi:acetyltransferase-like isoleucine patch superfamily enzyme